MDIRDCREIARRAIAVCLWMAGGLMAATGALADPPPPPDGLEIQSVQPFVLNVTDPKVLSQNVSLRFRQTGAHVAVSLDVLEARLPSRPDDFAAAFTPGNPQASAAGVIVSIAVDLTRTPFAGTYTVKVRPVYAEADKVTSARELQLTFTRPAAQLAEVPEITLDRTAGTGYVEPEHITLTERSNLTFADFSSPLVARDLRGPAGEGVPAQVELASQGSLPRSGTLPLLPQVVGSLPLGTLTGSVRLDSPQLATPVDIKLRIRNHVWFGWLPLTIYLFILIGLWFRHYLADRQLLDAGRLEAQRTQSRLRALYDAQVEQELRDQIAQSIGTLSSAMEDATTPDALKAAATAATTAVDGVLAKAAEERTRLRTDIATLKSSLNKPGPQSTQLRAMVTGANDALDSLLVDLDRGFQQTVDKKLQAERSQLTVKLAEAVRELASEVKLDVALVGKWPGTDIDASAASVSTVAAEADTVAITSIDAMVAILLKLQNAADVFLFDTTRAQIAQLVPQIVNALQPAASDPAAQALNTQFKKLLDITGGDLDKSALRELAQLAADIRDTLKKLIAGQLQSLPDPIAQALADGRLLEAATLVAKEKATQAAAKSKIESMGPGRSPTTPTQSLSLPAQTVAPRVGVGDTTPVLTIIGPATTPAGHAVELEALLTPTAASATSFTWTVVNGLVGKAVSAGPRFSFVPAERGEVRVQCKADIAGLAIAKPAQLSIQVERPATDLAIVITQRRIDRREVVMSIIIGAFIAFSGTVLFSDTFVGTWRDFFYAAIWGFTIDISAAKLRSLSDPITSRTLTLPAAGK